MNIYTVIIIAMLGIVVTGISCAPGQKQTAEETTVEVSSRETHIKGLNSTTMYEARDKISGISCKFVYSTDMQLDDTPDPLLVNQFSVQLLLVSMGLGSLSNQYDLQIRTHGLPSSLQDCKCTGYMEKSGDVRLVSGKSKVGQIFAYQIENGGWMMLVGLSGEPGVELYISTSLYGSSSAWKEIPLTTTRLMESIERILHYIGVVASERK